MSLAKEIKELLDQGDYLKASNLADEHKITDCKNICQNLVEINEITSNLDHSIEILSSLEDKIKNHEQELRNLKDTAFQMEEKEHAVQVQCKNLSDTCALIDELMENVRISDQTQKILLDGNLGEEPMVETIDQALAQLEKVLRYQPDPALKYMKFVRDNKEHANSIKSKFCERFYQYFTSYVDYFLSEFSESFINVIYSQSISMPGHDVIHNQLLYLSPLIRWVCNNDKSTYNALKNFYIMRSKTQYDKEFKIFFECAKEKMTNPSRHNWKISESLDHPRKKSSMHNTGDSTRTSSLSGSGREGTMDTMDTSSGKSSEISYSSWDEFDGYIEKILQTVDPTCLAEQRFYVAFFEASEDPANGSGNGDEATSRRLIDMFSMLESQFIEFSNYFHNQNNNHNGLYSLYLLVRLSQHLWAQTNSNLFLMQIYREVLVRVKRNFDSFMERQLNMMRSEKAPKQSKCGVLAVVKNFEQFAKQVEALFKSTGARRTDIDRWYLELVSELFRVIDRVEHSKTPTEMIRLENYYYLHDALRSIKVPRLEAQKKEANLQYKAALNAYVTRYFGRPLERVNIFFEGVQSKLLQGVKEEEISFQLAFSKQELRKVLQMVSLKEVRKGLEEMYRRIEKHAYEPDSNLIQVIWHAMQDEFLSQYKAIQGMIERCYPSSNLGLTFTIEDLLQVFSDIAQSH